MRFDVDRVRQEIMNLLVSYPELAEDELWRADMVEAETTAHDFLREVERVRREAESMAGACGTQIVMLEQRQERFERREKAMRALAFKVMETANLKKIEMPEATYSVRNGQQKVVGDADPLTVPEKYLRVKYELDRTKIKEALKAGTPVTGFTLSNAEPTLTILTK